MKKKRITIPVIIVTVIVAVELLLGTFFTPLGAIHHNLLLRGQFPYAFTAKAENISDHIGDYSFISLKSNEQTYRILDKYADDLPRDKITEAPLDLWLVKQYGPIYIAEWMHPF